MLVVWYLLFSFQLLHMIQQTHFNLIGVCNVINTKGSNNTLLLGKTKNSKMTFHFNLHQVYLTQVSPISFDFADNMFKEDFADIYIYLICRTATALTLVNT